ncbi:MAG: HEPN domain-containing protein [Bacteroidaceae bacterium]|nr:HEPN domain-containing protein [Bacteroidaceae bacterium]
MALTAQNIKYIVQYRFECAGTTFQEARVCAQMGYWNLCANRLYYALFYAAVAVLLYFGFLAKTHNGMIHLMSDKLGRAGYLSNDDLSLRARV